MVLWPHCCDYYPSPLLQCHGSCPAAIIWPQCCSNPVAFTSGHIATAAPCCNHLASMPWQPCGIYLWPAAALLQSFGLNAMATLWHLPLAGGCPAAIIWPQHCSNPVAFISGRIATAVPCCNHLASMPWQPCGIYLWPVAALLQSFGLSTTATLWHSPLAALLWRLPCCNHSASMPAA